MNKQFERQRENAKYSRVQIMHKSSLLEAYLEDLKDHGDTMLKYDLLLESHEECQDKLKEKSNSVVELKGQIHTLQDILKEKDADLKAQNDEIRDNEAAIEKREERISNIVDKAKELEDIIERQNSEILEKERTLEDREARIRVLGEIIKDRDQKISNRKEDLETADREIADLFRKIDKLSHENRNLKQQLKENDNGN